MNVVILADDSGAAAHLVATVSRRTPHAVTRVVRSVAPLRDPPPRTAVVVLHRSPIGARVWVTRLRQELGRALPIVAVVQREGASELPQLIAAGADEFLVWPTAPDVLAARLSLVERRHFDQVSTRPTPRPALPPAPASDAVSQTLQALLRAIPDTVYWLDADGVFTDFHCDDPRRLPMPPALLMGRRVEDALPRALAADYRAAIEAVLGGAPSHELEYRLAAPEGAPQGFAARFVKLGEGEVLVTVRALAGAWAAVTEAPAELGAGGPGSPGFLARVIAALPMRVFVYDCRTLEILYLNRAFDSAPRRSAADTLGRSIGAFRDAVHPDDLASFGTHPGDWRDAADGEAREACFRVRSADGTWRWVQICQAVLARGADGLPSQIVGASVNARGQGASAERLRASEERLRLALSGRDDLVYEWNLQTGELSYYGDAAALRGLPATRELWDRRIHEDDLPVVQAAVGRHLDQGAPFSEAYRIRGVDNGWRHCVDRGSVIRDGDGRPIQWIGVCTDITDRVERQDRLSQDQKLEAVAHLAGGVAQDFNKLLLAVFSHIDMAMSEVTPGPIRGDLVAARRAAEKAATLTRQLLAFGRRQQLQPEYLSINDVVGDAVDVLSRRLGSDIELSFESSEHLGMVLADPLQLEQILLTLGLRARETMPDGGRLAIITSSVKARDALATLRPEARGARFVRLRVQDSGSGIPAALLEHVFDPFYAAADGGPRTGLDLAMVFGIVDQHEGAMTAENLPEGGAAFDIYLPVVERPPARMRRRKEAARGGDETILLVDDDELVRNMAERMLRGAGYTVITARDGVEALRVFQARHDEIALAILDVVMPRMGGRAAHEAMEKIDRATPFIFTSGYTMTAQDTEFVRHRGRRFLAKPFNAGQLLREVRTCLDEDG